MPSGKTSKQRRRAAQVKPPPPVRAKGAPRQASPRVLAIGGAIAALIVVGIVIAIVLSGGKGSSGLPKNAVSVGSLQNALPGASEVAAELKGIPQQGTTLGSPSAPATMVEFIDLQCPNCGAFETQVFPDLVQKYVRTGKLKIKVEPWAFIGPDSVRGQLAMLAAAHQNKAFNFAQLLYGNQGVENTGWLNDQMVYKAAASVPGLKVKLLFSQRSSAAVKSAATAVAANANANGVNATPAVFVGKTGTSPKFVTLRSNTDEASVVKAIDAVLAS
jgi:protein-disulfide isomerase